MLQAASNSLGDVAAQLVEAATLRELTMAENKPPSSDPEAPTGGPESALPERTSEAPARSIVGTSEGNWQLWDGFIIDAALPPV
jgi:hypothetical protein